jgi:hypothetical protein
MVLTADPWTRPDVVSTLVAVRRSETVKLFSLFVGELASLSGL